MIGFTERIRGKDEEQDDKEPLVQRRFGN